MTIWNPNDKGSGITLSGSNLVAQQDTASGSVVRADVGSASGNSDHWLFEVHIDNRRPIAYSEFFNLLVGLANSSLNLNTGFDGVNAFGIDAIGPDTLASGVFSSIPFVTGDIVTVEKTGTTAKFYVNGSLASTKTLPAGTFYPAVYLAYPGDKVTANFGGSSFAHPVTGATAWVVDPSTLPAINITRNKPFPSLFQVATMSTFDPTTGEEVPPAPRGTVGGYFPDTIAAVLAGRVVRLDFLAMFDFKSGPMYLWQGFGTLQTNDSHNWQGIGQLGQISDLESSIGGNAPQARFTLSGVDPTILAEGLDAQEIYGRNCNVYMQFFDANFNCLDNPYVVWAGLMDMVKITQNVDTCQVELTAETIFARRSKPPLGMLSDREQQKFFPGDNSLAGIPSLMNKTAIWPVILPVS